MAENLWKKYKSNLAHYQDIGLMIDISRMNFGSTYFSEMSPIISGAFEEMTALEKGKIANPDENRMVGHYWLRAPELAPTPEITQSITDALDKIKTFTSNIHTGAITGEKGGKFKNSLIIGIGGSALGPQFLMDALGSASDPIHSYFFDNTDPDGMDRVLALLKDSLAETLTIVISKSGGTKETRNGMIEAREAYRRAGLIFEKHAVAVTGEGSELYRLAETDSWIDIFPMWDWVGGRTSVLSPVGLLPAALQGINIQELLEGARLCDSITRDKDPRKNPAAILALMWHYATQGRGSKDMVILPYKDRLQFFSRYLQQLIMESIGKETDLAGRQVNQGLTVYGNKGSTDQHAYVQQLRDGVNNFFVTFIEVLKDREGKSQHVETDVTSGDYLIGFLLGTREALHEKGRESITITLENVNASTVGSLIALYERAVGLYALMVNINAYHQPGVEAGKKAAQAILSLQSEILNQLRKERKKIHTVDEIASALNKEDHKELIFKILEHMRANSDHGVIMLEGDTVLSRGYQIIR